MLKKHAHVHANIHTYTRVAMAHGITRNIKIMVNVGLETSRDV